MRSRDDAKTFSAPVEITPAFDTFRPEFAWRVVATGPGHGIQLASGRLIVPVWLALGTTGNGHGPSVNATVYSDDRGATWHRGDLAIAADSPEFPSPNETAAVQLADGSVILNIRTLSPRNRRAIVTGKDGATAWSQPRFQPDLPDPLCYASLARLKKLLLFSNPDNLTRVDGRDIASKDRKNLTVRISYDEGASWPVKKTLEPGPSAYSDLAVLRDGTILCFYEAARQLVLARFNLEWLMDGSGFIRKKRL
jgi:sialidase-1